MKSSIEDQRCEVATYIDPIKADMVKELLDNEGIKCFIENANTSNANWLYTAAVGGINIIVKKRDFEKAQEVINVF
jgi:hypothetical protein